MKKLIFILILLYLYINSQAQYPTTVWVNKAQPVTQGNNPYCTIAEIVVDSRGNIYAAGSFKDSVRLDKNQPNNIQQGDENFQSGFFAKYDPNGMLLWAKVLKGQAPVSDISLDKFNNIYIAGQAATAAAIDFDPGSGTANLQFDGNDFFFAKYDSGGNYVWAKIINTGNGNNTFENKMHVIYVDSSLNIYLAGQFQVNMDADADTGTTLLSNPGGINCNCTIGFYVKYNNSGNLLWARADRRNAAIRDLHVHDATGKIALAGEYSSSYATPFRLVSSAGAGIDSLSGGRIIATGARFDAAGNIYYAGYFSSANNDFDWGTGSTTLSSQASYETVGFVAKYSSAGQFQWVRSHSPTNDTTYRAIYYEINMAQEANPILSFTESNGNNNIKGFYKINAVNGNALWSPSAFNIWVGGTTSSTTVASPADGALVFSCDVGFNGSGSTSTFDFNPNPSLNADLTGTGYWSTIVKYGNCITAPGQPAAISGPASLCNTGSVTYRITPVAGATNYTWVLPNGWIGYSDSNSITALPSANGGVISVTANNVCGAGASRSLTISYTPSPPVTATASNNTVCNGYPVTLSATGAATYVWSNGITNNTPFIPASTTTYYVTGTLNNCSNTDSITIAVLQNSASAIAASICPGQTYLFDGVFYNAAGIYRDTLANTAGCDSVVTLTLSIKPATSSAITASVCPGQTYFFNGQNLTTAGVYKDTLINAAGCDSIITLTLSIKQASAATISRVICSGQFYSFNGTNLNTAGVYRDTLANVNGCDSVITLNLTVLQPVQTSVLASICAGGAYNFNGNLLSAPGVYTDTLPAFNTCDSIITLTLTVDSSIRTTLNAGICAGQSYLFNGSLLNLAGTYTDTLQAAGGCDSIVILNLAVNTLPEATITVNGNATFCQGDSTELSVAAGNNYFWSTTETTSAIVVKQSGSYSVTATGSNNCTASSDSVLISVLPLPGTPIITRAQDTLFATPAYSYQWYVNQAAINGATESKLSLNQSGDYYVEITDTAGCSNRSQVLNVTGVQINDIANGYNFGVYPNPNQGQITIKHSYNGYLNLQIVNSLGMVVKAVTIQHPVMQLTINELANGVYYLVTTNADNERYTLKLVKE